MDSVTVVRGTLLVDLKTRLGMDYHGVNLYGHLMANNQSISSSPTTSKTIQFVYIRHSDNL